MSENIQALREIGVTPDALFVLSGESHKLVPVLELMAATPGELDVTRDSQYIAAKEAIEAGRNSPGYAAALATTVKFLQSEPSVVAALQGPLQPRLIAEIAAGISEIAEIQYSRMIASGAEGGMLPRQRKALLKLVTRHLKEEAGIELGMKQSEAKRRVMDFLIRAETHPMKALAGYVDLILNSEGMDTPTAAFLLPGALQTVPPTAEYMRMAVGSTETLQHVEGKMPSGEQLEALMAMETNVDVLMDNGETKRLRVGVAECMDLYFGHLGTIKRDPRTGEPYYRSSHQKVQGREFRMSELTSSERHELLEAELLEPVLIYSPFEPKPFLADKKADENNWSNMPLEKLYTQPAFEFVDVGSRDWVEYLIHHANIDLAKVQAVDVDIPNKPGKKPVPKEDAAADMEPLTLEHSRVKGKLAELNARFPPFSPKEKREALGRYMIYESVAVRFSMIKNLALAMFEVGNEAVLSDPAQLKGETSDTQTKAIGNEAYAEKYALWNIHTRRVLIAMYAPVTGQKEGFWPVVRAIKEKDPDKPDKFKASHLRFREPLGIGDWPELKPIEFSGMTREATKLAKSIIRDVFFARRRHRNTVTEDYHDANAIVEAVRSNAPPGQVKALSSRIRSERTSNAEMRSPVKIPRSRQDMYAMLMEMNKEQKLAIQNVDFRGYLESMGFEQMNLSSEEYKGWFGLLKAVEIHSFRHYDWGEVHKLIPKQIKYLTDAGKNFYALTGLVREMVNSITDNWQKFIGVDPNRIMEGLHIAPNDLAARLLKTGVEVVTQNQRTAQSAASYFEKMMKAMAEVADINFQETKEQRSILKATIALVDMLIGYYESKVVYETEGGAGEPGTKRKILTLDLNKPEDRRAARALRGAGFRVVVPGNYLNAYVTTGDALSVYKLVGKWDSSDKGSWKPAEIKQYPLAMFGHLGKEALLTSVVMLSLTDQQNLTLDDTADIARLING